MVSTLILFLSLQVNVSAQLFTFKIRKVPELKYFVFADEFSNHNLNKKTNEARIFPMRLYLQVYDNDTFLIRWSHWKLKEANTKLDYLLRDSLTYAGKLIRSKNEGMKFTFPFFEKTYNMFTMAEEPLVQKRKYEVGPPDDREKRIEFFFDYNKKRIILADLSKKEATNHPEIEEALKLSNRIKLGFFSNDLYDENKNSVDLPLNIVRTYPVHFVLANSNSCERKLYWNGVTTTRTLNLNDTAVYRKEREWTERLPSDVLVNINGPDVVYYKSRRYVYIENDSMVYVSNLNRGCDIFKDSLNQLDAFSNADYWDVRDGVNNYLVHIDKNLWGWISRYGCVVEWRVYEYKKIKKYLSKNSNQSFQKLIDVTPLNAILLNESCE